MPFAKNVFLKPLAKQIRNCLPSEAGADGYRAPYGPPKMREIINCTLVKWEIQRSLISGFRLPEV